MFLGYKVFIMCCIMVKAGQASQFYPSPLIQQYPLPTAPITHPVPFGHGFNAQLVGPAPFLPSVPAVPHILPALPHGGPLLPHTLTPNIAPVGPILSPAFAPSLPLVHHAVPVAPPTIAYKHSVPFNVPPFTSDLSVFNKLIARPILPAPIVAAPTLHHAPNFANLVHRPLVASLSVDAPHSSYFAIG